MDADGVLQNLLSLSAENEVVEFKEAENPLSFDKLQKEMQNKCRINAERIQKENE